MSVSDAFGAATWIVGDVRDALAEIPDGTVDLVLTSPPFLALRSYLPPDHPDKHREIGGEPTPAEFIDTLLGLSLEWRRVLAPHGSLAVELGDTYSGSGGAGGDYADGGLREGQEAFLGSARTESGSKHGADPRNPGKSSRGTGGQGWPLAKSLCLIPELYRVGLVYGLNPLTGDESPAGTWRARNVVRWCRPNPPVGSLGDKVRPATSDMVIACTSGKRWFDLDAVRSDPSAVKDQRYRTTNGPKQGADPSEVLTANYHQRVPSNPGGPPPLDHWWHDEDAFDQDAWLIPTKGYSGSHYAVWPETLLVTPILSMCPPRVCRECGEPSRRVVEANRIAEADDSTRSKVDPLPDRCMARPPERDSFVLPITLGWTDCGHDAWRPGVVLDPFAGSGTTLAVATRMGRDALGIDFDERNLALGVERVGWARLSARRVGGEAIDLAGIHQPAKPPRAREIAEADLSMDTLSFE